MREDEKKMRPCYVKRVQFKFTMSAGGKRDRKN